MTLPWKAALCVAPALLAFGCSPFADAAQGTDLEAELTAIVEEFRGDHDRYNGRDASFPTSYPRPWPLHWSQPWIAGALIATAADALAAFHHISQQPEFQLMQEWATPPRCPADIVAGDEYGVGLQRYVLSGVGETIGHDGHIIARTLLFRLGGTSYLIHTTRPVTNPELRALAQRLLIIVS